jgi:hypothetical protein
MPPFESRAQPAVLILSIALLALPARAESPSLPQAWLNDGFALAEFIAGAPLTEDEKARIAEAERRDFADDPAKSAGSYAEIRAALAKVRAAADPPGRVKLREALRTAAYFSPAAARDDPWKIAIEAHDPVIAADPASHSIVTERGLDALFASDDFVADLAGQPSMSSAGLRRKIVDQLKVEFSLLPQQLKESFALAEPHWVALQQSWAELTPAARQSLRDDLHRDVKKPEQVPPTAREFERIAYSRTHEWGQIDARAQSFFNAATGLGAKAGTLAGMSAGLHNFGLGFQGK